jgi:hypothetical protein
MARGREVIDRIPASSFENDGWQLGYAPYSAQAAHRAARQWSIGEHLHSFELNAATLASIHINGHMTSYNYYIYGESQKRHKE